MGSPRNVHMTGHSVTSPYLLKAVLERQGDLFRYLLEKFASYSGISGVQPKILVRDEKAFAEMEHTGHRLSQSHKGTHIVKMWQPNEYPQLAGSPLSKAPSPWL